MWGHSCGHVAQSSSRSQSQPEAFATRLEASRLPALTCRNRSLNLSPPSGVPQAAAFSNHPATIEALVDGGADVTAFGRSARPLGALSACLPLPDPALHGPLTLPIDHDARHACAPLLPSSMCPLSPVCLHWLCLPCPRYPLVICMCPVPLFCACSQRLDGTMQGQMGGRRCTVRPGGRGRRRWPGWTACSSTCRLMCARWIPNGRRRPRCFCEGLAPWPRPPATTTSMLAAASRALTQLQLSVTWWGCRSGRRTRDTLRRRSQDRPH